MSQLKAFLHYVYTDNFLENPDAQFLELLHSFQFHRYEECLDAAIDSPHFADVVFKFPEEGKQIQAHQAILEHRYK